MIQWLHLADHQRRATITEVEYQESIRSIVVEKDWWVTLTLRALFSTPFAPFLVFKGGTSLSKCWGLIARFSEDIDVAVSPEAFDMAYLPAPSKKDLQRLRRAGCAFTTQVLREALERQFAILQLPQKSVTVLARPVPESAPDMDPQILFVRYKSLYPAHPYVLPEVKIEVSVRSLLEPHRPVDIMSLLSTHNPGKSYPETPTHVFAAEPQKTFLEKIFLMHEEFQKPNPANRRHERMSRHLYDLSRMANTIVEQNAFGDRALYTGIINHRRMYNKIGGVDYTTHVPQTISFLPPENMRALFREDYISMQRDFIFGHSLTFDELLLEMERLQERIRALD